MRPMKVAFQAFGPYAGQEVVDFEALSSKGLFLICGKTGIGKTMILDAITFALFGKSSGHGRDDFESMRCTNAEFGVDTFVRFEFENNGEYYLFERRLERKRKNLSPSYHVSQREEDGSWRPLMENAKEKAMNEKAVEIIGLEYEQFRQVIVLPQGQFERLLTSGSDEKERILTSIFGEDKWQMIAERFYAEAEKRRNEWKRLQEKIQNILSEEKCATLSELEFLVSKKKEQEAALQEEYKKADYEKTVKEQREALIMAKRFGDLRKAEKKLSELSSQKEARLGWERTINDAKRAERVRALIEAKNAALDALSKRRREEESAGKTVEEKKRLSERASERVRLHREKEKEIEGLKEKKILYEGKRESYRGLEEAENELREREKAAEAALLEEKKAREASEAFAEAIVRLQNEYASLQAEHGELLNSYLAGITGEIASHLKTGQPCPVCGSREHPHKAHFAENGVTRAMVDQRKKASDQKYRELKEKTGEQERLKKLAEEKHEAAQRASAEVSALFERLESRKQSLVKGIPTALKLEEEIKKLWRIIEEYEASKEVLLTEEKKAKDALTMSRSKIEAAEKETEAAEKSYRDAESVLWRGLEENLLESPEKAEELMLKEGEKEELSNRVAAYDAGIDAAKENVRSLREELKGKNEPDEEECRKILERADSAQGEYREKKAVLSREIERLEEKAKSIRSEGEGIEEKMRIAEEDFAFAKKLRGDSGTGLQRYVLGIMFSSVITAANRMLEMVHGGRYRLYRSDEKAQGSNKRGLELKVFDKNSGEHDGRFVSTLSGGEKFLASLALSIGMSTVAQRSGIKIEALFIDEGFGSLDDDSIGDAMTVLSSIREANGLVGIISHVQLLEDQIPTKLRIVEDEKGSHIVKTIG